MATNIDNLVDTWIEEKNNLARIRKRMAEIRDDTARQLNGDQSLNTTDYTVVKTVKRGKKMPDNLRGVFQREVNRQGIEVKSIDSGEVILRADIKDEDFTGAL